MTLEVSTRAGTGSELLFEKTKSGKEGVFLPERKFPNADFTALIPRELQRQGSAELPEITEPELVRHFVNLSKKNWLTYFLEPNSAWDLTFKYSFVKFPLFTNSTDCIR